MPWLSGAPAWTGDSPVRNWGSRPWDFPITAVSLVHRGLDQCCLLGLPGLLAFLLSLPHFLSFKWAFFFTRFEQSCL